jgi:hypothetical protein
VIADDPAPCQLVAPQHLARIAPPDPFVVPGYETPSSGRTVGPADYFPALDFHVYLRPALIFPFRFVVDG